MKAVSVVTIKNKIPLFKGDEKAISIELIELEEVGYELVSQIGLYEIGDKAVLIQPDYCVPDTSLFESFIRPNGQENKSMLGKVEGLPRRIRAKKFTLSKEPYGDAVYSNGILLPLEEVYIYCNKYGLLNHKLVSMQDEDLTSYLEITKYEEPENTNSQGIKTGSGRAFPTNIYKTDEENINNLWNHLEYKVKYPVWLIGTEKIDGSSITIGTKKGKGFICSRNIQKNLTVEKVAWLRKPTTWEWFKSFFGIIPKLEVYETVWNTSDDFVNYGRPYLLEMLKHPFDYVLRGEISGGSLKGSGNKNNPASKQPVNIKFFGVDSFDANGKAVKIGNHQFKGHLAFLTNKSETVVFEPVKEVFSCQINSKQELLEICNNYFKDNMIEGIVVRTLDSTFSAKVMNLEYDSKK